MNTGGSKSAPPEEKLLRLIRGKPAASSAADATALSLSPAAIGAGVSVPRWVLLAVNAGLAAVLVAELVAFGLIVTTAPAPAALPEPARASASSQPAEQPAPPSLAASVARPIFAIPQTAPPPEKPAEARRTGLSQEAKAIASSLKLIGIVAGDPAQAIIEDGQKTNFVSVGQALPQGAVVTEIHDNRVTLDFNGETIQLSL